MNKIVLKYGLLLSVVSIILYLIDLYIFKYSISAGLRFLIYISLYISIPFWAALKTKRFQNNIYSYTDIFGTMVITFLIGFFLTTIFDAAIYLYIDPNAIIVASNSPLPFMGEESRLESQYQTLKLVKNRSSTAYFGNVISSFVFMSILYIFIAMILSLFLRTKSPNIPVNSE